MAKDRDLDYPTIVESINHSRKAMEHFRERRRQGVGLYAGAHYSTETGPVARPLNLIRQYVDIFGASLISKEPRVMFSTMDRKQKAAVRGMQDWLNKHIVRMELADVLQRAVIDSFYQLGIVKVALATPADSALSAYGVEPGDPYACSVSLNNFVFDVFGESKESLGYVGHWIRVPIDAVKDGKIYGPGRKELEATEKRQFTNDGDEMTSTLSGWAAYGTRTEAFKMVDLLELYLPRQKQWVTFGSDGTGTVKLYKDGPLRQVDWIGPRCGPFHYNCFGLVPDSFMPAGTIPNLIDLDFAANDTFRKLWRQAQRAKENDFVESSNADDAKTLREANDGEFITLRNPGAIGKLKTGGPMPELVAFLGIVRELFNHMGGNVNAVGGLAPSSETVGQDKLIAASSSGQVSKMQAEVVRFVSSVVGAIAWFFWENPFKVMHTEYNRKGMPQPLQRRVYPAGEINPNSGRKRNLRRELPFEELDVSIDPYSLSHTTPEQRAMKLRTLFIQLIAPIMPLFQQQGLSWDMEKFMRKLGEYENEPDYADIMGLVEPLPPEGQGGGGGDAAGSSMGAHTSRENIRRDAGGKEKSATEQAAALMGSAESNGSANGRAVGGY